VTWFRDWCNVVEGEGIPIDYAIRNWMTQTLTGRALFWHKFNLGQHIDVYTADSFKEQLMEHFAPFYKETLLRNWWGCKQEDGELLTDFISRASIYISELFPNYREEEKVAMVFKKVNRHFKLALSNVVVTNMKQLMMVGRTMQNNITECQNQRQAAPTMLYADPALAYNSRPERVSNYARSTSRDRQQQRYPNNNNNRSTSRDRQEHGNAINFGNRSRSQERSDQNRNLQQVDGQRPVPPRTPPPSASNAITSSASHERQGRQDSTAHNRFSDTRSPGPPSQRPPIICKYCGKVGHVAAECYSRIRDETQATAAQQPSKNL
jgi:hypothetical protein